MRQHAALPHKPQDIPVPHIIQKDHYLIHTTKTQDLLLTIG